MGKYHGRDVVIEQCGDMISPEARERLERLETRDRAGELLRARFRR